jgi:hypothetical protein
MTQIDLPPNLPQVRDPLIQGNHGQFIAAAFTLGLCITIIFNVDNEVSFCFYPPITHNIGIPSNCCRIATFLTGLFAEMSDKFELVHNNLPHK